MILFSGSCYPEFIRLGEIGFSWKGHSVLRAENDAVMDRYSVKPRPSFSTKTHEFRGLMESLPERLCLT